MIAPLVLALVPSLQDGASVQELLDQGRHDLAWAAVDGIEDPLLRSRARTDVLFRGRDFDAALASATAALGEHGPDAYLLLSAARAALWLRDGAEARRHLAALLPLAEAMEETDARTWWLAEHGALAASSRELEDARAVRDTKLHRAKLGSLGLVGAALVGLFGLARGARG